MDDCGVSWDVIMLLALLMSCICHDVRLVPPMQSGNGPQTTSYFSKKTSRESRSSIMAEALLILTQRRGVAGVWPGVRVRIHSVEPGVGEVGF
jgi:hypothetical protein